MHAGRQDRGEIESSEKPPEQDEDSPPTKERHLEKEKEEKQLEKERRKKHPEKENIKSLNIKDITVAYLKAETKKDKLTLTAKDTPVEEPPAMADSRFVEDSPALVAHESPVAEIEAAPLHNQKEKGHYENEKKSQSCTCRRMRSKRPKTLK